MKKKLSTFERHLMLDEILFYSIENIYEKKIKYF